jgi:hypothetical protein
MKYTKIFHSKAFQTIQKLRKVGYENIHLANLISYEEVGHLIDPWSMSLKDARVFPPTANAVGGGTWKKTMTSICPIFIRHNFFLDFYLLQLQVYITNVY